MNPAAHSNQPAGQAPPPAFTVDDALFTLFKHKRIILVCFCLGAVAAAVAYLITPVIYSSTATLMVTYVNVDITDVAKATDYQKVESADTGANILTSESEIIRSLDTAKIVATNVGPEKILAAKGGGDNPIMAAAVIRAGINVLAGRQGEIMTVLFEHPDRQVVQPVLSNLIHTYMIEHVRLHSGQLSESVIAEQKAEVDTNLMLVETELNQKMHELGVVDIEASKGVYKTQTERLENDLITARTDLDERKRVLQELAPAALLALETNKTDASVPSEKLEEYNLILSQLSDVAKRERELSMQGFKDEHPLMVALRSNREDLQAKEKELEAQFPSLAGSAATLAAGSAGGSVDVPAEMAQIRVLGARVAAVGEALEKVKAEAFQLNEIEPQLSQLKRDRDDLVARQSFYSEEQNKERTGAIAADNITNIKIVENPTPPIVNNQRRMKLTGALFGGFLGLGLVAGFLMDLVLDRTIKRSADIKRRLHLPVFLAIPDTSWAKPGLRGSPRTNGSSHGAGESTDGTVGHHIAPWEESHHLYFFTEGLRERLVTYFDINNLSHKPKLVAVTGCDGGAGVTTLASGLAASLSKTGDGNVLFVDMTNGQGVVKSFYKGKPGAAEPAMEDAANGQSEGTFSSKGEEEGAAMPKILPKQFTNLVPVLEAKNYDYIIFDMPPVSATSVTPRLASHMDLVLLVLESEKTVQHTASRAGTLLAEARANAVAVLNKCRRYVPERLSPEL